MGQYNHYNMLDLGCGEWTPFNPVRNPHYHPLYYQV